MLGVVQCRGTTDSGEDIFHIVFTSVDTVLGMKIDELIGYAITIGGEKFICGIQCSLRNAKDKNLYGWILPDLIDFNDRTKLVPLSEPLKKLGYKNIDRIIIFLEKSSMELLIKQGDEAIKSFPVNR